MASILLEPFRHSQADFRLADEFTAIRLVETPLDRVEQAEPIQGVLYLCIVGEGFYRLQNLLLSFQERFSKRNMMITVTFPALIRPLPNLRVKGRETVAPIDAILPA
ncbi:MAG TPA: hypothetical protein VKV95_07680 [Terriglobia bacterium]|nr:hypothetical protein [Terriglobia bacterium]